MGPAWLEWKPIHFGVVIWKKGLFTFVCVSSSAKDKGEKKLFGFSFVPLMQEDGRTLPDATHELIVHKVFPFSSCIYVCNVHLPRFNFLSLHHTCLYALSFLQILSDFVQINIQKEPLGFKGRAACCLIMCLSLIEDFGLHYEFTETSALMSSLCPQMNSEGSVLHASHDHFFKPHTNEHRQSHV